MIWMGFFLCGEEMRESEANLISWLSMPQVNILTITLVLKICSNQAGSGRLGTNVRLLHAWSAEAEEGGYGGKH